MNTPTPPPDDHEPLEKALRRDATRLQAPPFDAALHHAAMRRIRALSDTPAPRFEWKSTPALVAGLAVMLIAGLFSVGGLPAWRPEEKSGTALVRFSAPPTSAWAYTLASGRSEEGPREVETISSGGSTTSPYPA